MKVAIYTRVSTREQTTENQRIPLVEYAERMGYEYEIIEEVESTRKTRPMKYALMQRLRHKEFGAVLVAKLDRWARSMSELVRDIEELEKLGIKFISLGENIDFTTPAGRLQYNILASFANFERDIIRERTMEGLRRAKLQGHKLGRPFKSKDKNPRRKSGYLLREPKRLQKEFEKLGIWKDISYFINNPRQIILSELSELKKRRNPPIQAV
jgi:putative DNA-invertase from lambdoid prophage Rac